MPDPYTRPCDGTCGDDSFHNAHLTAAGHAHYTGEPFPKNIFQDSTSVEMLLGELAGFASVCWQQVQNEEGKTERVFDSDRASLAVQHALARLDELNKEKN